MLSLKSNMSLIFLLTVAVVAHSITERISPLAASSPLSDIGCLPMPEGTYTGDLRPQIHFSPPKGFMNDPNGCFVDADGTWHLYYQCMIYAL